MKSPRRFWPVALAFVFFALGLAPAACGEATSHPTALDPDKEGGVHPGGDGSVVPTPEAAPPKDSSTDTSSQDGASEAGGDGGGPGCSNGVKDNVETDVDCGGTICPKCKDGLVCKNNTDCAGNSCVANDAGTGSICTTASCKNGVKDGAETDVDCGGGTCPKCSFGRGCALAGDCAAGACAKVNGVINTCTCPSTMAIVATNAAVGGAYCVDATETQMGDYNAFVNANQPIATQIDTCKAINTTFVPQGRWPPPQPLFSFGDPVRNVDWCDAYAYCKWAGKQLCGKIGGGSYTPDGTHEKDPATSSWYNACSAQGVQKYPYDVLSFDPAKCRGNTSTLTSPPDFIIEPWPNEVWVDWAYDQNGNKGATIYNTQCQGGSTNLFQMSGNVAEWEDACDAAGNCLVRGGAYTAADNAALLACDSIPSQPRMTHANDIGFRCCQY